MKITVGQLLGLIVVLALIGAAAFFGSDKLKGTKSEGKTRQAVFLNNGQVYFGYLSDTDNKTVTLKDIYYLQVQDSLQPASTDKKEQPQVSLVKLGNELHGPVDEMKINRDHVLFWEDMKDTSKVNQAIADFVKNGGVIASPTPTP